MAKTVAFPNTYPWNRPGGPARNRPYAEVKLIGPTRTLRIWCLVDSGADSMLVDAAYAGRCGISLAGPTTPVVTASGGIVHVHEVANVDLEIEGVARKDTVRFLAGALPLLGRVTFLNAFTDVGLDAGNWMTT
jgi:hypothetical protein